LAVLFFAFTTALLFIIKESLAISHFHALRKAGLNLRNVLVVGTIKSVCDITSKIEQNPFLGLKVIGLLVPEGQEVEAEICNHKILGNLMDIERVLHNNPIDHVIITVDRSDYNEVDNIVAHCEEEGVEIWLTASLFNLRIAKLDSDELFGMPLFIFRTVPKYSWQLFIKNVSDIIFGLLAGAITLPIIAVAAILIKATSKGPVLFKQKRMGLQGREFTLYKLRTMCVGAHEAKESLNGDNLMKGPVFKLAHDPRVTPVGRFLRKTSIDELPQIWNVLKGEMSLVGPRPPLPDEVNEYKGWHRRRLSMKPGITGLWQVSGRSNIADFNKWVELDLKYIDNWSLSLDIQILLRTIFVVLTGYGAH
jgi:exopolysaccharide biosynthesis polyprenyl glycosylphosphotransferase